MDNAFTVSAHSRTARADEPRVVEPGRGEFALTFPAKLTARPFAHLCLHCRRGSARAFYCTRCDARSVTAESLARFSNERAAVRIGSARGAL